ncbi:MAG: response regulator transcription factor [Rhodocyclaceae bacterium]|nr:response regulator transcription factor [Rhodocyclaceae bacterium]MBP6109457.1 response regulator transcription factor [Rhodocyclaceae bacterium]MBP6278593.1 response regulator transcription factor [Rhodocyclaceae bacterium]
MEQVTALVADDEPLLRERLISILARVWPELVIVAEARNGREAVELFDQHAPQIVFLDVHMPGMNGIEAARCIGRQAQIVFVTAHENYAVEAFRQGAIDYVVKPFDEARLLDTVLRLRQRLSAASAIPVADGSIEAVLEKLAKEMREQRAPQKYLSWIKASVGAAVRLIPVAQIFYLRSDAKYTLVVWQGGEALIRRTIRELADELDPDKFAQIHRSTIVNLHFVKQVTHGSNETGDVHLTDRTETLPVSRSYLHLFRQM